MGLFGKGSGAKVSRRAARKAHQKALYREVDKSAKNQLKISSREIKATERAAKSAHKAELASQKSAVKLADAQIKIAKAGRINPRKVRNALTVVRLLAPVLAPLAYRGATLLRGQIEEQRAKRLGVSPNEAAQFSGPGARLAARIYGAGKSLEAVADGATDAATAGFVAQSRERLTALQTALTAADRFPISRRRTAHQAVSAELTGIEGEILRKLGLG